MTPVCVPGPRLHPRSFRSPTPSLGDGSALVPISQRRELRFWEPRPAAPGATMKAASGSGQVRGADRMPGLLSRRQRREEGCWEEGRPAPPPPPGGSQARPWGPSPPSLLSTGPCPLPTLPAAGSLSRSHRGKKRGRVAFPQQPRRAFAKQRKFIDRVIDHGAAASLRLLRRLIPFSRSQAPLPRHHLWCRRKARQERAVLVPALPVTRHMGLGFSLRKTER